MDTLIETVQRTKIFEGDKVVEPTTTIFLQEQCFRHRFIRRKDTSGIVERPERLRAVAAGLSAALARLEDEADRSRNGSQQQQTSVENPGITATEPSDGEQLTYAMSLLDLSSRPARSLDSICRIIHSTASADLTSHPGARFIHAPQKFLSSEEDYLATLKSWAVESQSKIMSGASEIPDAFSQGDLYLCPESFDAISGAIGTVCEAVDCVVNAEAIENSKTRSSSLNASAFVAVRPPGHHCGEATPAGFCFVNNVAVGAAHAHLQHNVDRVIILDIDLHHGNGTQKLAWRINEETRRTELEGSTERRGLKIFYGSLHDVLSYPCEDGDADMIRDASVSLHDAHGQYIENIHLQPYASEQNFHESLYEGTYSALFEKAMAFVKSTGSIPAKTLVFISCGFDACEHEHTYMSRHDRKVPTSFYKRFAMDATALAKAVAGGKIVSVLEGGYSDRALMSGAIAYLAGLACGHSNWSEQTHWWSENNLTKLEKLTKKPRGRSSRVSGPKADVQEKWLDRTQEIFTFLDRSSSVPIPPRLPVQLPQPRMTLRGKKKPAFPDSVDSTPGTSPDRGERFILSDKRGKTPTDERATSADVIQASSANIINVGRVGNDDEDSSRDTHGDSTSDLNARNSVGSGAVQIGAPAIPGSDGGGASLPPTKPLRIKIVKPRSASSAAVP
ncbi:hypothetical protein FRB96_001542 [Tulasnella sp. 330]|nr:hypothetical protein FRB96_001542 [Tulasnella sp. 330]KAG8886589.1 hypothetical protein FRB97_000008 [Tulasnella sp. 331]